MTPTIKVLVAEDNRDSRELVSDILLSLGYTPILAENGRIALEKVLATFPDLVILDMSTGETVQIQTNGPVWNVTWGQ